MNRQPRGTPVGGRFAEGRNPDGGDLTSGDPQAIIAKAQSEIDEMLDRYSRENRQWSYDTKEVYNNMMVIVTEQRKMIERLEAAQDATEKPAVYVTPSGKFGYMENLMLMSRSDVDAVGGMSKIIALYEEHGEDLIDAVRAARRDAKKEQVSKPDESANGGEGPKSEDATERLERYLYVPNESSPTTVDGLNDLLNSLEPEES